MLYAIILCVSILALFALLPIYYFNKELFLCSLIVISSEMFYLTPKIGQYYNNYKLFLLIIITIMFIAVSINNKLNMGRYGLWVIGYIIITFIAVSTAYFAGQDIMLGIKAAKFAPLILIYFVVTSSEINIEKFLKYFITMGVVLAGLITIQYAFMDHFNLFIGMPKEMLSERLGRARIAFGGPLIVSAAVAAIVRFMQTKKIPYLIVGGFLFFQMLYILQTRAFIAAFPISLLIIYLFINKLSIQRIITMIFFVSLLSVISLYYVQKSDIENIRMVKMTKEDIKRGRGSYGARIAAYDYYWNVIKENPFLGQGLRNIVWVGSKENSLRQIGINLSDIGIMHLFVQSGILGMLWFIPGIIMIWIDILRYKNGATASFYIVIATITMPTIDLFLREDTLFIFAIFLGLFSLYIKNIQIKKNLIQA
jgi:hypothetical protein